uniref:Uncharacterized protein n=1 Tax=Anopheles atroparvus TaxID=41427 RepID=A0AAG5CYN8_ANOAO
MVKCDFQNSENRAQLTSPKPNDVVLSNEEDTTEFKTPVAPAPKRRLYSKKAFDTKTPENKTPSPFAKISSQDYLNILDNLMNETHVENGQNDSETDETYINRQQQQAVGRRVLPSRASRSKIKTLSVDELAGVSPEMKICKPKFLPEMSPLLQETDEASLLANDRRRVLFQNEVAVKEFDSPNIVGDIIKKVTGRGRRGRALEASSVLEEVKVAEVSQDSYPTDDDQNTKPKRAPRKPRTKQVKAVESVEPAVAPIKETKGRRGANKENVLDSTSSEVAHVITEVSDSAQPTEQQEEISLGPRKTRTKQVKENEPPTTPIKVTKGRRGAKKENAPDLALDSSTVSEAVEITEASQSTQFAEEQEESSKRPRKTRTKQVKEIDYVKAPTTPIKVTKGRRGAKKENTPDLALDSSTVSEAVEITEASQSTQFAQEQEESSKKSRETKTTQVEGIESIEPPITSIKETKGSRGAKRKNALDSLMDSSTISEEVKMFEASQVAQPVEEQEESSKRPRKTKTKQVEEIGSVVPKTTPIKETKGRRGAKQKNALDPALDPALDASSASEVVKIVEASQGAQPVEEQEESSKRPRKTRTKKVEEMRSDEPTTTPIKETKGRRGAKQKNVIDPSLDACILSEAEKAIEDDAQPAEEVSSKRPRKTRAKQLAVSDSVTLVSSPIKETRARRAPRKNVQVAGTDLDESFIPPTPEPKAMEIKEVEGTGLDGSTLRISPQKTTKTTKRRNQVETAPNEKTKLEESTSDSLPIKRKRGRPVGSGKAKA